MKMLLLLFLLSSSFILAQDAVWETIGEMPRPVAGGREWVDRENIYILGGYSDSLQADVNWIQKYSSFLFIWKMIGFMEEPRFGLVADRFGEDVLFFGGVQQLNVNNKSLEKWGIGDSLGIVEFDYNFNRILSTGLIYNDKYYIIGGNPYLGGSSMPYIIEYDLINSAITYESSDLFVDEDVPDQQMSANISDDIYIFGGVNNSISQKIYKFNTTDHSFERLPVDLLEPRAAGRAILFEGNDEIYIIGGYNETSHALNTVEVLKVTESGYEIRSEAPLNTARSYFMAAYLDDNIYVLGGYDENGNVISSIEKLSNVTSIAERMRNITPDDFQLYQNYPNPFNPSTSIEYSLPIVKRMASFANAEQIGSSQSAGFALLRRARGDWLYSATLKVYDVLGKEVATLVDEQQPAGRYRVNFDAAGLPSGMYFYKLETGNFQQTKKMLMIK